MDRKIFVFWCGDNPITDTRKSNLQTIIDNSCCDVQLVTNENINDYIVEPFHEAYQYLSVIHKCDYWKAYFAYFYGCGYSDIKECRFDWNPYFEELENSENAEIISYTERGGGGIALRYYCHARHQPLDKCMKLIERAESIPGVCHYIFKQKSTIAKRWREIQHEILDANIDTLIEHPGTYHIGAVRGGVHDRYVDEATKQFNNSQYPFSWSEFGGMIYHDLCGENLDKCLVTMPFPICGEHWK